MKKKFFISSSIELPRDRGWRGASLKILIVTQHSRERGAAKNRAKSADYSQINSAPAQWGLKKTVPANDGWCRIYGIIELSRKIVDRCSE